MNKTPLPLPEPPPEPRSPRWLRWTVGFFGALATVFVVVTFAVLGLVATGPGLELVRRVAVGVGGGFLTGELSVGAIRGSALSRLVLEDVRLTDDTGLEAVAFDRLTVSWRPTSLMRGTIDVEEVVLQRPRVKMVSTATGGLNLARLVPPGEPKPEEPPSDEPLDLPQIRLGSLRIDGGSLDFVSDGDRLAQVQKLELKLDADAGGAKVRARLERLEADVQDGLPLLLELEVVLDGDELEVAGLELTVEDGRVELPYLKTKLDLGSLSAPRAEVEVPAPLARRLGAPAELQAGANLHASASRTGANWVAALGGTVGDANLTAAATIAEDLSGLNVWLNIRDLDPGGLWAGLPRGRMAVTATAAGDLSLPRLEAIVRVSGRLKPDPSAPEIEAAPLDLLVGWTGDRATARATGRVGTARLDLDAAVAELDSGTPLVERAKLHLEVPELSALLGSALSGRVAVDATASGPVDDLATAGRLDVRRLSAGPEVRVARLRLDWDVAGLIETPTGRVRLDAGPVELPGRSLDRLRLRANAKSAGGAVDIAISSIEIDAGDVSFQGDGKLRRSPDGAAAIERLTLRSTAGTIGLSATVQPEGDMAAKAKIDGLDLGLLPRSLVPELDAIGGKVDLGVEFSQRAATTTADLALEVDRFALAEDKPSVGAQLQAKLRPGTLSATAKIRGLGDRIELEAAVPAPRDATQPAAWTRALGQAPMRSLSLDVERLDLALAQRFAGLEPAAEGPASLRLRVSDRGERAEVDLAAGPLRFEAAVPEAEARVLARLRFGNGRTALSGRVEGNPIGSGTFTATAATPRSLFDVRGWSRMDDRALEGARVDLDVIRLTTLDEMGLVEGLTGDIEVHLSAGAGARPLAAVVAARKVRLPQIDGLLDGVATLALDDTRTFAVINGDLDGDSLLRGYATAPLTIRGLLSMPPEDLTKTPVDVALELSDLGLPRLLTAVGVTKDGMKGHIEGRVRASGSLADPSGLAATASVAVRKLVISGRRYEDVVVAGRLDGEDVNGRVRLAAAGAGGVTVSVLGKLGGTIEAILAGDGLPLRFLSQLGLLPIGLDGSLYADAKVEIGDGRPVPAGWIEVRNLRTVFPVAALRPLHSGRLRVEMEGDEARVEVGAKSDGGQLDAKVQADLTDFERPSFTADAKLARFPVAAGQMARVDLQVDVTGGFSPEDGTRVDVLLHDGRILLPDEQTRSLHPITSPAEVEFVDALGPSPTEATKREQSPSGPPSVVTIRLRDPDNDPISIRGGVVEKARIALDIVSRTGTSEKAGLRGRVWVPDGTLILFERIYRIDRADVVLDGRDPPNPRLDIRLVHDFLDIGVEFTVRVSGFAEEPRVEFSSSPARFSDSELLQIFLGTHPSELGQTDERSPEDQAAGAALGFLAGPIQQELRKALPLDTLDVDVSEQGVSNVALGKWITREVFVAYRQNFQATSIENDFEAIVKYRFLPGWMAEAVLGQIRNDLDILWTRRF